MTQDICYLCGLEKILVVEFLCLDGRLLCLCKECSDKILDNEEFQYSGEDLKRLRIVKKMFK